MSMLLANYNIRPPETFVSGPPLPPSSRDPREHVANVSEQSNASVTRNVKAATNTTTTTITAAEAIMNEPPPYRESPFPGLFRRIRSLGDLEDDWNSYGAAAPNTKARFWAHRVLEEMVRANIAPVSVSASSDEGVAIFFVRPGKRASIECLNSGEILGVLSEGLEAPDVMSISQNKIKQAVSTIQTFLTK
jgi:hypothetical protein